MLWFKVTYLGFHLEGGYFENSVNIHYILLQRFRSQLCYWKTSPLNVSFLAKFCHKNTFMLPRCFRGWRERKRERDWTCNTYLLLGSKLFLSLLTWIIYSTKLCSEQCQDKTKELSLLLPVLLIITTVFRILNEWSLWTILKDLEISLSCKGSSSIFLKPLYIITYMFISFGK
jgi:hypothetical protein